MNSVNQTTIELNVLQKGLLKIAQFQKTHWFISIFLIRLSAVWFSLILAYFGETLSLIKVVEGTKSMTWIGAVATGLLILAILLFEAAKHVESHVNRDPFEVGGFFFLNSLRKGINKICDSKLSTLIARVDSVKKSGCKAPTIVSDPPKQLQGISDQIVGCLSQLLAEKSDNQVSGKDIYATIAYQFPQEGNEWHWATEERGLGLDQLVPATTAGHSAKSTFLVLLESGKNYVFYNRKQEAFETGKYICDDYDEKDDNGKLKGSIACYKLEIKKNDTIYVRAVLSITSYQQQFSSDESNEVIRTVRKNMDDFVISDFSKRIKIELCLLYLSFLQGEM